MQNALKDTRRLRELARQGALDRNELAAAAGTAAAAAPVAETEGTSAQASSIGSMGDAVAARLDSLDSLEALAEAAKKALRVDYSKCIGPRCRPQTDPFLDSSRYNAAGVLPCINVKFVLCPCQRSINRDWRNVGQSRM